MTDRTSPLAACFRRLPEDAYEIGVTRGTAADIMARSALPQPDRSRILAMPYPVEHQVFWQVLADLGVTQERLMDRMGSSP